MSLTMHDFDVKRCTRRCAASGRDLAPRETIYSKLVIEGREFVRYDYCEQAWSAPAENENVSWWKSRLPAPGDRRIAWAPHQTLLQFFDRLESRADEPGGRELRFVAALLLVRRRIARIERTETATDGGKTLVLFSPINEREYCVPVAEPSSEQAASIQRELVKLLASGAAVDSLHASTEPAP